MGGAGARGCGAEGRREDGVRSSGGAQGNGNGGGGDGGGDGDDGGGAGGGSPREARTAMPLARQWLQNLCSKRADVCSVAPALPSRTKVGSQPEASTAKREARQRVGSGGDLPTRRVLPVATPRPPAAATPPRGAAR